jgi:hypothetical protein
MAADHELIKNLSATGSRLISIQLGFSNTTAKDISNDAWTLGYCYGFIEAIGQSANLLEPNDFLLLMTVTFDEIAGGKGELKAGADLVADTLKKQQDPLFPEAVMAGGADFMAYRANQNIPPMGLANHLGQKG